MGPSRGSEPTPAEAKVQLRARLAAVTRQIAADPEGRARRSAVLCRRLAEAVARWAEDHPVTHVMVYRSLLTEPDLAPFVAWAERHGLRLYHPEPVGDTLRVAPGDADPAILDVVVVPGRAFTAEGLRLGRGGGHFDQFLPRLRPDCLKVAVAYHEQVLPAVPLEPHDVSLDLVVTDA